MTRARVPGRRWAYCGALLGGAVSIAANVAHSYVPPEGAAADWTPELGAVVGAVFWPIALFVAIEILARVAWPAGTRWLWLRFGGLVPVALVAAIVSYRHLSGLLDFYGEDPLTVVIGPLAVDGLMVMATAALIATSRSKRDVIPLAFAAEPLPEPVGDPWQYAVPIGPEPAGEPPSEPLPEPVREPVRRRTGSRTRTAAERVTAAHAKHPTATHERIAKVAGVSVASVKRHRPNGPPTAPVEPSAEPPAEPVNGNVPDLAEAAQ